MPTEKLYRGAVTGEYVTEAYAAEHPDTTVGETVDVSTVEEPPDEPADAGYSLIELCVCVLVIIVLVLLIVHYVPAR